MSCVFASGTLVHKHRNICCLFRASPFPAFPRPGRKMPSFWVPGGRKEVLRDEHADAAPAREEEHGGSLFD